METTSGSWRRESASQSRLSRLARKSLRIHRFLRASAWFPACQALANVLDQPAACRAQTRAPLANDMDRHGQPLALTDLQLLEPPRANVLAHHMPRHVAPPEACEKIIKAGGEVGKAPDAGAVDPSLQVLREGRAIRHHQLDLLFQDFSRERARLLRKRMIGSHYGHH